ncbi:cell division protein FtsZ [Mycoplasmopsis meleagridis]|uniref:cell division protein FtsZ n=1 Tax=Mycoplasmopsis meleagridis TaxID=29561 RepID=UPI00073D8136|nr:cell division protein FtsZ [Mycoplasmopsis meleagridis]KUH47296.1 hypothetical protein ASB56_02140 [Mycoplasmopsis meleagridis]
MENFNYKTIKIKVIGIGGAGNNAINFLINENLQFPNIEYYVANTDYSDLDNSICKNKIHLTGETKGWGAGGDNTVGESAAEASKKEIEKAIEGADLIILVAGLGGGTGTGAAPVIAKKAKDANIITLSIVFMPFAYEGKKKLNLAQEGLDKIKEASDSYVVIDNEKIFKSHSNLPSNQAFKLLNSSLKDTVIAVNNIISKNYFMNVDFNDLRSILKDGKRTFVAIGKVSHFNNNNEMTISDRIVEYIFNNISMDEKIIAPKKMLYLVKMKNGSIKDIAEIKHKIAEKFKVEDDDLEVFTGCQDEDNNANSKDNFNDKNNISGKNNVNSRDNFIEISIIATGFNENENSENKIKTVTEAYKEELAEKNIEELSQNSPIFAKTGEINLNENDVFNGFDDLENDEENEESNEFEQAFEKKQVNYSNYQPKSKKMSWFDKIIKHK